MCCMVGSEIETNLCDENGQDVCIKIIVVIVVVVIVVIVVDIVITITCSLSPVMCVNTFLSFSPFTNRNVYVCMRDF